MNTRSCKMDEVKELKALVEAVRAELGGKIDTLVNKLIEKDEKIVALENKIMIMEEKIAYNDVRMNLLERRLDDSEQYTRRTSLRLNGIPYSGKETGEESLNKVKAEVAKLGITIDDCEFDRAHRVGRPKDRDGNMVKERQMIVKFSTFRSRTLVYRNRKAATVTDTNNKVRFYIDQTKRRFELRKMADDYVRDKPDVDFVFVDINCNLCVRLKNGEYKFFNSREELINIVG